MTPTSLHNPIGIFGGSGLYSLLDGVRRLAMSTPFGEPSAPVAIASVAGPTGDSRDVVFLPRHGERHQFPPHRVNYRANVWVMHALGVRQLLTPFAAGSLNPAVRPGDLAVCDQFVDRTAGRASTFFDGPSTFHLSIADPYCPRLSRAAADTGRRAEYRVHDDATVVVIEGPRFSTRAESRSYRAMGFDLINMTQSPEVPLARELGMCVCGLGYITDYDTGVEGMTGVEPVTQVEVMAAFEAGVPKLRKLLLDLAGSIGATTDCECSSSAGPRSVIDTADDHAAGASGP